MHIHLKTGTLQHVKECSQSLLNSELGKRYFVTIENCEKEIMEFVEQKTLLVALDENNTLAGFVCHIVKGAFHSFPYLHIIVVAENSRGKGYGALIMDQFEEMVFRDKNKLFLVVADFNPKAKSFYLGRGFDELGCIPGLYRENITEYIMMKRKPQSYESC